MTIREFEHDVYDIAEAGEAKVKLPSGEIKKAFGGDRRWLRTYPLSR